MIYLLIFILLIYLIGYIYKSRFDLINTILKVKDGITHNTTLRVRVFQLSKDILKIIVIAYLLCFLYGVYKMKYDPSDFHRELHLSSMDNYYNLNTTGWQDFHRMSGQFNQLFFIAFGFYKDWIIKSSYTEAAYETEIEIEKAIKNGLSTRGGIWEFICNGILYSAYGFGHITFCVFAILVLYFGGFKSLLKLNSSANLKLSKIDITTILISIIFLLFLLTALLW